MVGSSNLSGLGPNTCTCGTAGAGSGWCESELSSDPGDPASSASSSAAGWGDFRNGGDKDDASSEAAFLDFLEAGDAAA